MLCDLFCLPSRRNQIGTTCKPQISKDIVRHSKRIDQQDNLWKIECELQGKPLAKLIIKRIIAKRPTNPLLVDIYYIGIVGFYQTLIKLDTKSFVTSLYKIDQLIKEKEDKVIQTNSTREELDNKKLIDQKLLRQQHNLRDIFSKVVLDILALHYKYNLKIELKERPNLRFSSLCQYTLEELQACKQYLVENLSKGFINTSQALFATSILFVQKANKGL